MHLFKKLQKFAVSEAQSLSTYVKIYLKYKHLAFQSLDGDRLFPSEYITFAQILSFLVFSFSKQT